jgi:hypothetical protein
MKRLLMVVAVAAAAAGAFALVNGAAGKGKPPHAGGKGRPAAGKVIHVIEHATTDTVIDAAPAGDSRGDTLAFANAVFDAADAVAVGSDQGSCVRTVPGQAYECNWTTFLPGGQITVEGPFFDTKPSTVAITGGTGRYQNARGSMELSVRNATEFDFIFHVIG